MIETTHPDTDLTGDDLKRHNAIKASRTMLLMQWPAYTVLGLIGILLPIMGAVDEVALISVILLITAMTQVIILVKYGVNPGFFWRFSITSITLVASFLIYTGVLSDYFNVAQIMGGYLAGTGAYIVIEGRYSFSSRHIEKVVYCGYFAGVLGLMLFTGWPDLSWWSPVVALSLYLLALGNTARVFIYREKQN